MQKLLIVFITLSILCFSCKKEKPQTPEPTPKIDDIIYLNYAHLKPGNYWVYQVFEVDTLGNATATSQYDSVFVSKDTVINGKTYAVKVDPLYNNTYLRDSLHYIVNSFGRIVFSSVDFYATFSTNYFIWTGSTDTVAYIHTYMTDKDKDVTVPAGSFKTVARNEHWFMFPGYRNGGIIIEQKTKYNIDIGIVSEALPFIFHNAYLRNERRLVRYFVQ